VKNLHRLQSQTAGPVWGLVFGAFMTAVGIGLWWYAETLHAPTQFDESVAVAATLIGVFLVVYAGREIHHKRNR
jgi:apolipoprotein N-acyltransferase